MSYETDRLQQEINSLKWQKAENYQLETLNHKIYNLSEKLIDAQNKNSWLEERVRILEEKLDNNPSDMV